ncbi:MAG: hypothetical protein ABIH20_00435 [Candidatus Diapherotrites archaeon]
MTELTELLKPSYIKNNPDSFQVNEELNRTRKRPLDVSLSFWSSFLPESKILGGIALCECNVSLLFGRERKRLEESFLFSL